MDEAQEAQERLLSIRKKEGVTGMVKITQTTSIRPKDFDPEVNCWKHPEENKPCQICQKEEEKHRKELDIEREKWEREKEESLKREKQHLFDHPEAQMEKFGVGKRYLSCSFDNFVGGEKYTKAASECAEDPHDLVLWGGTGSGKTHLAVAIMREIVRRGVRARFITVPFLLLEIRGTFGNGDGVYHKDSEEAIIDRYSSYPVLILDDLGSEKSTEWSITTLFLIIDRRYQEMRPTIITTNLSPAEIEKELGSRIASRLAGMRIGQIQMPDYRKKR